MKQDRLYTHLSHLGQQRAGLDVITKFNNQYLLLVYSADQNDFDTYLPEVENMINSIWHSEKRSSSLSREAHLAAIRNIKSF